PAGARKFATEQNGSVDAGTCAEGSVRCSAELRGACGTCAAAGKGAGRPEGTWRYNEAAGGNRAGSPGRCGQVHPEPGTERGDPLCRGRRNLQAGACRVSADEWRRRAGPEHKVCAQGQQQGTDQADPAARGTWSDQDKPEPGQ